MPVFTANELKRKSSEELAILGERNDPLSAEGILIKNELQRRLMQEQHELSKYPSNFSSLNEIKKKWYEKPFGILLIGILTSFLAWVILCYYGFD